MDGIGYWLLAIVAACLIAFVGLIILIAMVAAHFIKPKEIASVTCPTCGYNLRHTPDRCPECGTAPTNSSLL